MTKPSSSEEQLNNMANSEITLEEVNEEQKAQGEKSTKNIGARINRYVYLQYKDEKNDYLPMVAVIETVMIYFLTLSHSERIKFLNDYSARNIKVEDLKDRDENFNEFINEFLEKSYIPKSVINKMDMEDRIKTVLNIISNKKE